MAKLVTLYKSSGGKFEEEYLVATDWSLINDKPTNFVPTAHSHVKDDIDDFAHTHDDRYLKKGKGFINVVENSYLLDSTPVDETVELQYIQGEETTVVDGQFVISKPTKIISKSNNLFDKSKGWKSVTKPMVVDGYYVLNTVSSVDTSLFYLKAGVYAVSFYSQLENATSYGFSVLDELNVTVINVYPNNASGLKTYTFTIIADGLYYFNFRIGVSNAIARFKDIQLNEGTVALPYQPYAEHTYSLGDGVELPKLPNGVGDRWYSDGRVERNVGKVVLNGSEPNWYRNTIDTEKDTMYFYKSFPNVSGIVTDVRVISNNTDFSPVNSATLNAVDYECISNWASADFIVIRILKSRLNSLDSNGFKEWLADNNLEVYYQLATLEKITTLPIPEFISTYDGGYISIDSGKMALKIPCNITDQVNNNTKNIVNIKSQYATKTEVNTSFAAKATTLSGYGITNAYTQYEVNTRLNNKADLVSGKIPANQLPSFVDDVLEFASFDNFPYDGESGKIYIDKDTNKTYRWSGSKYAVISETLALGETPYTAYSGTKGKANALAISNINTALAGKLGTEDKAADSFKLGGLPAVKYVLLEDLGKDYYTINAIDNTFAPISSVNKIINGTTPAGNTKKVAGKEVKYYTQSAFASITPVAGVHYIVYEN